MWCHSAGCPTSSTIVFTVAPRVEECAGGVGTVESNVVCVVEVCVKVHLKGVSANISKLIQVDPVVTTQIFFKERSSVSPPSIESPHCSTSLYGAHHILSACKKVTLSEGIQTASLDDVVTTKEVTYCDYLSEERPLNLVEDSGLTEAPVVASGSGAAVQESVLVKPDVASERDTDQEDFGYATEECQEGYTTETNFADNEDSEDEEEKSESTTSGANKLAHQITSSEEETKSVSSTIEKPPAEESLVEFLTGTLEESCFFYNDYSRSPTPTFEDDLLLPLANTEKVSKKQEEFEILPVVEDTFRESATGTLEEANHYLCSELSKSLSPSFEDETPLLLVINKDTIGDQDSLIKKETENQVLVKSNFEVQEFTEPKENVEKQHGHELPSEDSPVSTSALPKLSLEGVSAADFEATSYRHRLLRAGDRAGPRGEMEEGGGQQPLFTAPLQDYLAAGGLEEAWGYLRVLGCLVVGDLSYLLPGELEALPLLPRRRLMEHVKTLALTPPAAPPADAPLDQCLVTHGLHHVLGYVSALGARCVGDVRYLTEDDLRPLPPVSRRRLLLMGGRMSGHHNSDKEGDYHV